MNDAPNQKSSQQFSKRLLWYIGIETVVVMISVFVALRYFEVL